MIDQQSVPAGSGLVNKSELASILRTSLPTLDKLLRRHGEKFPVVTRGSNGVAYAFDPAAVIAFLAEIEQTRVDAGRAKDELMQQYQLPDIIPLNEPTLNTRERLDLAKLRQIERDERVKAGFLVETSAVRAHLATFVVGLRRDMNSAIRQSLRSAGIPEPVIRNVEARVHEHQRGFVKNMQAALLHSDPSDNGAQTNLL